MAEPRATVLLGDRGPRPAHGGDLLPQRLVVGLRAFEDAPHRRSRTALAQEFARLFAQLLQVVAEIEIHAPDLHFATRPLTSRSWPPRSASSCSSRDGLQRAP